MIVGGRNNQVGDSMPLDIYDTDSSDWYRLPAIERFRHASFMIDANMFIHGGFDQVSPSVPTDTITKIDLNKAFKNYPALYKSLAFELGHDIINHNTTGPSVGSQRGSRKEIEN
jgi:protein phosphatase